jgi:hypothetical protein
MTLQEITAWAQAPENESHPKYPEIMSELALIELHTSKMHDHESPATLREWWQQNNFQNQQYMAKDVARMLGIPVQLTVGQDPGDEFFENMKKALKIMVKTNSPAAPVGLVLSEDAEERLLCVHDCQIMAKVALSVQSCNFLIDKFDWNSIRARDVQDTLAKIRHDLMHLFEQSVNFEFRIKGTPMVDVCEGVDWSTMMVKGRTYGNFAVDLCELRGRTRESKDSLN